jgi:UPF0716 protein FxsA
VVAAGHYNPFLGYQHLGHLSIGPGGPNPAKPHLRDCPDFRVNENGTVPFTAPETNDDKIVNSGNAAGRCYNWDADEGPGRTGTEMFRRLLLAACIIVAADVAIFAALSCLFGWRLTTAELAVTTVIGLAAILRYERRWADMVTRRLESDQRPLEAAFIEKTLLLVAGIIILIPGVLTDAIGLLLIVPWVRRRIACRLSSRPVGVDGDGGVCGDRRHDD